MQAPLLRCDPTAGHKADHRGRDAGRPGGRHAASERDDSSRGEPAVPEPAGGSSGVQVLSPLLEQIAVVPNSSVGIAVRNAAATGDASLILDSNAQWRARWRRRADEHHLPVHELQHHQRHRQSGHRANIGGSNDNNWLRLREPLGPRPQDERPGPLGEGASRDLRSCGASHVRVQASRTLGEKICKTDGWAL